MFWNQRIIENLAKLDAKTYRKNYKILEEKILADATNISNTIEWLSEKMSALVSEINELQNAADECDDFRMENKLDKKLAELNLLIQKKQFEDKEWEKAQLGINAFKNLPAPKSYRKKRKSAKVS